MTRSPNSRGKHSAPAQDNTQHDIIARAVAAYLANAQSASERKLLAEQAVWLQAALILEPELVEARLQLIDVMIKRGAIRDAITLAANLVEREPQHALALWHLGYALQLAGHHAEAVPFYQRAYAIDSTVPTLRNNLAVALEVSGHTDESLKLLEEAVAENVNDIEAWTNLSRMYPQRGELEHAIAAGKRAVQIDASNALAQSNYSLALKEAQRWTDATAAALAAAEAAPQTPRFPFNLSLLDLIQCNYPRGWANFENRWDGSSELAGSHPAFEVPRWNGEPLRGKTLLLWGEQGFGDALQFCRFVPMLARQVHAQGGKLVWVAFKALHPLMARMAPKNVECIPHDAELPAARFPLSAFEPAASLRHRRRFDPGQALLPLRRQRARGAMARAIGGWQAIAGRRRVERRPDASAKPVPQRGHRSICESVRRARKRRVLFASEGRAR